MKRASLAISKSIEGKKQQMQMMRMDSKATRFQAPPKLVNFNQINSLKSINTNSYIKLTQSKS